jgi:hypothetical protein
MREALTSRQTSQPFTRAGGARESVTHPRRSMHGLSLTWRMFLGVALKKLSHGAWGIPYETLVTSNGQVQNSDTADAKNQRI